MPYSQPEVFIMAIIAIKDLPESVDLDRQAMLAIVGGARFGGRQHFVGRTLSRGARIIDYPGALLGNAGGAARPDANIPGRRR